MRCSACARKRPDAFAAAEAPRRLYFFGSIAVRNVMSYS